MAETMRAYVLEQLDAPARVTEIARPAPGSDELLVRMHGSSVNPFDHLASIGALRQLFEYRLPAVLGRDVGGVVAEVGESVEGYEVGDAVFGVLANRFVGHGSFADYVVVRPDEQVVHAPRAVDPERAGAIGLSSVTALLAVDALELEPGQTVFVNGATGGVGSAAVQIAAARRGDVIATARPGEEAAHVTRLGATETVDWSAGDTAAAVRALRPDGVDGAIDLISPDGDQLAAMASAVLAPDARIVTTRGLASAAGAPAVDVFSRADATLLRGVRELVESGRLTVPVSATYPLEQIDEAFAALAGGALGKVAVRIGP